jgi:hypothetical protein
MATAARPTPPLPPEPISIPTPSLLGSIGNTRIRDAYILFDATTKEAPTIGMTASVKKLMSAGLETATSTVTVVTEETRAVTSAAVL